MDYCVQEYEVLRSTLLPRSWLRSATLYSIVAITAPSAAEFRRTGNHPLGPGGMMHR
jgi:hypothetical protein